MSLSKTILIKAARNHKGYSEQNKNRETSKKRISRAAPALAFVKCVMLPTRFSEFAKRAPGFQNVNKYLKSQKNKEQQAGTKDLFKVLNSKNFSPGPIRPTCFVVELLISVATRSLLIFVVSRVESIRRIVVCAGPRSSTTRNLT